MESAPHPIVAFIPLILMMIPILIVNIVISNRKSKNPTLYGLLSLIPGVSLALLFYLLSINVINLRLIFKIYLVKINSYDIKEWNITS